MSITEAGRSDIGSAPARSLRSRGQLHLANYVFPFLTLSYLIFIPLYLDLFENPLVTGRPYGLLSATYGQIRNVSAVGVSALFLLNADARRAFTATWPLWPFALFSAISCMFSPFPKSSFEEWRNLAAIMIWVPAFVVWVGLPKLIRYSAIITAIVSISSILAAVLPPHLGIHHITDVDSGGLAGDWRGIFIHKNVCGEVSVTSFIFSLRNLERERPFWKVFFWAARFGAVAILIKTTSANALSGALGAGLFFALMSFRPTSKPWALLSLGTFAGLAVYGFSLNSGMLLGLLHKDATLTGRTEIWAFGRDLILQHLWFGHGFATDGLIFGQQAQLALFHSAVDLHSGYLDMIFNVGIVGGLILVITSVVIIGRAYLAAQTANGVQRESVITYMTLFVSACIMAIGETSPFHVLGDGAITFWFSLIALSAERLNSHVHLPKRIQRARQFPSLPTVPA